MTPRARERSAASRVLVGMSGGCDSTAAAHALRREGFEVLGITFRFLDCPAAAPDGAPPPRCGADPVPAARAAAERLGIPLEVVDARSEFGESVLRPCWESFSRGETPNPCVLCNARLRFRLLSEYADRLGAEFAATGHYARVAAGGGGVGLLRGDDPAKDQSYFLHAVPAALWSRFRFPLACRRKSEVREEMLSLGLIPRGLPESQDVCFAGPDGQFAERLRLRFGAPAVPGEIVSPDGKILGRHGGIHRFTIGQRKGLGIATGRPMRVVAIDATTGRVTVSPEQADLFSGWAEARDCRWLSGPPRAGQTVQTQVRYRQRPVEARVVEVGEGGGTVRVAFSDPVSAVTPGQSLVLYDGERVLGGGILRRP